MVGCLATLAGLAVAWGVTQATIRQLKELVTELRKEVADLKREVGDLHVALAEIKGAGLLTAGQAPGQIFSQVQFWSLFSLTKS
jgi:hypothetical protein